MRRLTDFERKKLKHSKKKYSNDMMLRFCASMFFWCYMTLSLGGFDTEIKRKRKQTIDKKIILSLEIVKFMTRYNKYVRETKGKVISYKDLIIIWGLVFDKESLWNEEIRKLLDGTGCEYLLDREPHVSYNKFFDGIDSDEIEKINFQQFLAYIPKDMFMDAITFLLNCDKNINIHHYYSDIEKQVNEIGSFEILGYTRGRFYNSFKVAVAGFNKRITNEQENNNDVHPKNIEEWIVLYKERRKELIKKLHWEPKATVVSGYTKKYTGDMRPSNEERLNGMEPIWKKYVDNKKKEWGKYTKMGYIPKITPGGHIIYIPPKVEE